MAIKQFQVNLSTIVDPGSVCSNPSISWKLPTGGLAVVCDNGDSIDIQINDGVDGPHCLTFIIDCVDSCSTCGQIEVQKCFCIDVDDCENCSDCQGNVCVSRCSPGQVCNNNTCSECSSEQPCLCNQVCTQGVCRCPADRPVKRADGCCVECLDGEDLGNCRLCFDGTIVTIDCPNGHCNPNTGECQECYNNQQCTEPNECCTPTGSCDCCPGYIRDVDSGQCVLGPKCTDAQFCIDRYGPCSYCTENGCAPIVCPAGFICDPLTGDCVPSCEDGVCPEGQGCLNGRCVPCSSLSCTGSGPQCQFANGCECSANNTCEWVDCNPDTVGLEWVVTEGTAGTPVPGSGLPALQGSTVITPSGIVYAQPPVGSSYMNHQFSLSVTNGTSGTWVLYNTPTNTINLGSGTNVSFSLSSTGPNLVGFLVKFTETGTGRTATWGLFREPTAALIAPNVWHSEFDSTGTPPNIIGGTPGTVQLCATNGNFTPVSVANVQTTGDINVTLFPSGGNCMTAHITGCGEWNGDIVLQCGGNSITVAAPSFFKDPANCCDPTDPNCDGWGTGDPCNGLTVEDIDLVALPTYGQAGNGDGEFLVVADFFSAGLSFFDLFYLNPAPSCWSTAANPGGGSDAQIVTNSGQSPLGPSVSNLSVVATIGDGGCVRLGYTCELKISGCKKLQGEVCLSQCDAFTVDIVETGTNTYTAVPSLTDETVTYEWSYPGLVNNTGQTVVITPIGGPSTLIVTARYGTPTKCTAIDQLILNTQRAGCTNTFACNYDATATSDDGSCVLVGNPTYDCTLGGFQPGTMDGRVGVTWKVGGNFIVANTPLNPGTYVVEVYIDGVFKCTRPLLVPQCYRCNGSGNCVAAPLGNNNGLYSTINCDGACSCDIEINITQQCSANRGALVITATGDTGSYTVTVDEVGGSQVLPLTAFTSAGSATTPLLCNGVYRVVVQGVNCSNSRDFNVTCWQCANSSIDLENVSYDCGTNQLFVQILEDACSDYYNVRLLNSVGLVPPGGNQTYTSAGNKTIPFGVYPGDGVYTVRLTDSNGCVRNVPLSLNCNGTLLPCPIDAVGASSSNAGGFASVAVTFSLSAAGGSYKVDLYNTTGGVPPLCLTASANVSIANQTTIGVLGTNVVNFANVVSVPGVDTCYIARVQRLGTGYESCVEDAVLVVGPTGSAPPVCSGSVSNVSYNTSTGEVLVSWDFENTSNDLTVQIDAYASGTCGTGGATTVSVPGNGEDGINIPFSGIPQIPGTPQCIRVTVFDTADPSCSAVAEYTLAGCTCAITVDTANIVVDPDNETIEVPFTSRCTVNGEVNVDISGDATGSDSILDGSTDGTTQSHVLIVPLSGYPSPGGTATVEISDADDVGCIVTQGVVLPGNCVSCGMAVTFVDEDTVVTDILDTAAMTIATGSYDMDTPADLTSLETDIEAGLILGGANFCLTGTKVDVARNAFSSGAVVRQDNDQYVDLDHAVIEHPTLWAGGKKVYFGDCGCDTGRVCDYTVALDVTDGILQDTSAKVVVSFGVSALAPYAGYVVLDFGYWVDGVTPSEIAAAESLLLTALQNAAGCNYTVDSVDISYDSGTEVLTIDVNGTNAGLGLIYVIETDGVPVPTVYEEFTQSNCT